MPQDYEDRFAEMEAQILANEGVDIDIVDDLIATGGTAEAAVKLVRKLGGKIVGVCFVVDLPDLGGTKRLQGHGIDCRSLMQFEGE